MLTKYYRYPVEESLCVRADSHEALCTARNDWTRYLIAHGQRAAIDLRLPFQCEVRRMKLGHHQGRRRATRNTTFRAYQVLRSHRYA